MPIAIQHSAPLLQVFDMPTAIAFYRDVLGFKVVATSRPGPDFHWALLELDAIQLMLNTAYDDGQRPPAPDPKRVAAHDDTIIYFRCPDVDAAYEHVRAKGYPARQPSVAPYGMKQLYLNDPDGYGLCFQFPVAK